MKRLICSIAASLAIAGTTATARDTRQHFSVRNGSDQFTVTRIDTIDDNASRYAALIRDEATGKLYQAEAKRSYAAQTAEYRLTDLATKESVSVSYKLPLKAKNRADTETELRAKAKTTEPVPVTISAGGSSATFNEHEWRTNTAAAKDARAKLKAKITPAFSGVLTRLQPVLAIPFLAEFCHELVSHFTAAQCGPVQTVRMVTLPPDCGFDAKFGERCSTTQAERAKAVRQAGHGNRY